ncbi:ParA family protein [Methylobacterium sp. J-090]|uniref:ParA family protein n=1 Tax=Methylobacterium sp. J-090 TaxID=2836666 RepID=UPI001FB9BF85|nr:ParA family protein [Methylobacterium sp. J-090]MCJ2080153.1 ParA family protein [Methylobacterium sp. J-090]
MKTLALVSQKGGAGKTTLALHLAVAAHRAGLQVAIADLDPQSSAWKWSERRREHPEAVVTSAEQLNHLQAQASAGGLDLLIIDSAPHADRPALVACKAADLVLIPCRASILDIDAIGQTHDLTTIARKPSWVVFNACNTSTEFDLEEARGGLQERGIPVYPRAIYQRVSFSRGFIPGKTAVEIEPGGRAATEVQDLFKWVAAEIGIEIPAPSSDIEAA